VSLFLTVVQPQSENYTKNTHSMLTAQSINN